MKIAKLQLKQFRSYESKSVSFDDNVTLIVGKNGAGKTNILEAIHILLSGSSFRDSDSEVMRRGGDWWQIKGVIDGVDREVRYESAKKSTTIDDKTYQRLSDTHKIPLVLFEPDDLLLIHAQPGARRAYIDKFLSHLSHDFTQSKKRYDRALRQRNTLLKQPTIDSDTVFVWDMMLAREGAYIRAQREVLLAQYNEALSEDYEHIASKKTTIVVEYKSTIHASNYEQALLSELESRLERDRYLGFTSVGPHRDDVIFMMNDTRMDTNASRGEIRSLLLALKQFESDVIERTIGSPPIVLLDDVFSELDSERQATLLSLFVSNQVIITTTEYDHGDHTINLLRV